MRKPRKPLPRRTSFIARSTKPIARLNVKRAARKRDAYAKYLRSSAWRELRKAALERAGHQCEYPDVIPHPNAPRQLVATRCTATTRLEAHHTRYTKVRPNTSLDDLWVLCHLHHEYVEKIITPWRSARRVALARAEGR